ncbi:MAG TPA: hypothetical protein VLH36_12735 [Steroidobacteraceae bacterium]|nr:hypothetical protein [Steroidobacteraceae bacterium]
MSPTETRTISSPERGTNRGHPFDPSRLDLPAVIRAIFDCTRNVTLHQSLESFGVSADPLGPVRPIYPTGQGTPVVTVWHDRIEADADGSLVCRLDPPVADSPETALLFAKHVGREVYVLLLKRDPSALDPRRAGRNAPDIVMWTLEADLDGRFVLRRPTAPTVHA